MFRTGTKMPIQNIYHVVKLKLKKNNNSKFKFRYKSFTDEILGYDNSLEVKKLKEASILQNLILEDLLEYQDYIYLLIELDYYYNIVTANIKQLIKNLNAVETIFGWYCLGIKSENQSF